MSYKHIPVELTSNYTLFIDTILTGLYKIDDIPLKEKDILAECLLLVNIELRDPDAKPAAVSKYNKFMEKFPSSKEIMVDDYALFWMRDGYYCLQFLNGNHHKMTETMAYLKNIRKFKWHPGKKCMALKQYSNDVFASDMFFKALRYYSTIDKEKGNFNR